MRGEKELHEVAEIVMGQSPKGDTYNNHGEGTPLLNGPSEFGEINPLPQKWTTDPKRFSKKDDILFCVRGSTGRMNWSDNEYCIGRGLCAIRAKSDDLIDTYYIYYSLKHNLSRLLSVGTGSVFPNLSKKDIYGFRLYWPETSKRKFITTQLKILDDKIEINRQMNRTLEAMARAIFKSWFVDFDSVYAKMEGRDYPLPAEVMDLFPDELVESELGLIPKGWEVGKVSDFGKVITGKTPSTKNPDYYFKDEVPFLKIPDMHNQFFITETTNFLSKFGADSQKNKYIPAKSICVSCIATPGLVVMPIEKIQTNQQINSVVPKSELFSNFLLLALKRKGDEIRIRGSGGSVLRNLNKTNFSRIQLLVPSERLIESFEIIVTPIFEKTINNLRQNNTLSVIRDIILPKLMNGEIDV